MTEASVSDHGYVRLVKSMGDDLDVVNSAKVSFAREANQMERREARLLAYLAREGHSSTLRHSAITFEVYAPLMVARQWFKYVVASAHTEDQLGWNESSRRYITEEPTFHVPEDDEWRSAPEGAKQGSGNRLRVDHGRVFTHQLKEHIGRSLGLYDSALAAGVAPEQARLFLPAYGLYVRWRWTASLGAVVHFLLQRLAGDAQEEISEYARAVRSLTSERFPATLREWVGHE